MKKLSFRTFLEDFHNENSLTAEEAADLINTRGQQYRHLIGDIHNHILYRGMRERFAPNAVLKWVRTNRRPLTTNAVIHKTADEFFEEKFGIKFRSNSIFAVGEKSIAEYYGDLYAVFPLDDVKICWSEEINDLTNYVHKHLGASEVNGKFVHNSEALNAEQLGNRVYQMLHNADYTVNNENLKTHYFSRYFDKYELMINCEDYVAVRVEFLDEVLKLVNK